VLEARQFDARRVLFESSQSLFTKAVRTVEEILDDPDAPRPVRLQAARIAISAGFKARDLAIEVRLERLEERDAKHSDPEIEL
jgi:hypothetical protein